jgi:DNA modification methylase
MECPYVSEYVGTDVIPQVCRKTSQFAKEYYPTKTCTIYCEPSENLMKHTGFSNKYRNYFDAVFFSPPYYELELYPGKNQSTTQYKTYEEWLEKYWLKTIQLCHHVLKSGGKMCYILSGYGSDNTNGSYDLLNDMNGISQKIFTGASMRILPMYNKNVHVTAHRETAEKIMIFVK